MKVKELIQKYFEAIFKQNPEKEAKLYKKITKKSLKGKKTQRIKDVDSLRDRVSVLETAHQTHEAQHASIVSDHEAIKSEHSDLNAKFDRVFTKANTK